MDVKHVHEHKGKIINETNILQKCYDDFNELKLLLDKLIRTYKFTEEQLKTINKLLFNFEKIKSTNHIVDLYEELINIKRDYHDNIYHDKLGDNDIWNLYTRKLIKIRNSLLDIIKINKNHIIDINKRNIVKTLIIEDELPVIADVRSIDYIKKELIKRNEKFNIIDGIPL